MGKTCKTFVLFLLIASLASCGLSKDLEVKTIQAPDYTSTKAWAAHPEIKDGSDSSYSSVTPNAFQIPVFFVSPTVYFPKKGMSWNADVGSEEVAELFESPIAYQASAFQVAGPVYSPIYRQSAYQVYQVPKSIVTATSYQIAYEDVKSAFVQFRKEIGPTTPFVLASHSQGTDHLVRLIKEHLSKEELNQLVVAYLVGMEIDHCEMPISLCESPDQNQCFVSWRTYHHSATVYNKFEEECIGVVNPLSWTTEKVAVTPEDNLGAFIDTDKDLFPNLVGAQIKDGVVRTDRPEFPGSWLLRTKNYHRGDINLYYSSIQENLRIRCLSFLREDSRR